MKIQKSFKNKKNNLYILASPIGNLEEINKRFIKIIIKEKQIICESIKKIKIILNFLNISFASKNFIVANKKNENNNFNFKQNENYVLISDAGYPLISDPGYKIVKWFKKNNFNIIIINGSSSILSALLTSTFSITNFYFFGFIGKKNKEINDNIDKILSINLTTIIYINVRHVQKFLEKIVEKNIHWKISIARELTKINETVIVGYVEELLKNIDDWYYKKGEYTIVIRKINSKNNDIIKIKKNIIIEKNKGKNIREIIKIIKKKYNISKNIIYKIYLDEKEK